METVLTVTLALFSAAATEIHSRVFPFPFRLGRAEDVLADLGKEYAWRHGNEVYDAIAKGDTPRLKALLKEDSSLVFGTGVLRTSALHWAAEKGDKETVALLLAHGAPLHVRDGTLRDTPLERAAWGGQTEVARLLLAKGARLDIFTVAGLGMVDRVAVFLQKNGKLLEAESTTGYRPLHWASASGQRDVVAFLLAKKGAVNAPSCWEYTALHLAAQRGHLAVVKLLLEEGAAVNVHAADGSTALHKAVGSGRREVVQLLLAHKADASSKVDRVFPINAFSPNPTLETPLHMAASYGQCDIASMLLAHKAEVNALDSGERTPLDLALSRNDTAMVQLLRLHGGKTKEKR